MKIPIIRGMIDRRILVNYRVDPAILAKILPLPFQPKLAEGFGMAGICLIRLKQIRPRFVPSLLGLSSENAAHRIAVQWRENGRLREGVYIPRRDTSSRLNALLGGRVFPGEHHHARFQVEEQGDHYLLIMDSHDHSAHITVEGHRAAELPESSIFETVQAASEFFKQGALGYSITRQPGRFDGIELRTQRWHLEPLALQRVESSYFEDRSLFPRGSVELDSALLMRGVPHEWHGKETLEADRGGVRREKQQLPPSTLAKLGRS